MEDFVVLDVGK